MHVSVGGCGGEREDGVGRRAPSCIETLATMPNASAIHPRVPAAELAALVASSGAVMPILVGVVAVARSTHATPHKHQQKRAVRIGYIAARCCSCCLRPPGHILGWNPRANNGTATRQRSDSAVVNMAGHDKTRDHLDRGYRERLNLRLLSSRHSSGSMCRCDPFASMKQKYK